jgi:Family of unknown function (DUF6252)
MTFKIDSTTTFTSSTIGSVWEPTNSLLNITAKGGKSIIVMNLALPNGIKAGTYNFTATSTPTATFYRPDTSKITEGYYSNIDSKTFGTLIITSVTTDSLITGTFTYNLKDPTSAIIKKITAGVFTKVKVVNNKSLVSTSGNTCTAKIDGTAFTGTQVTVKKSSTDLVITALDDTRALGIQVPAAITVGNYTMNLGTDYIGQYNPTLVVSGTTLFVAVTATSKLTITENNTTTKSLKGTFNFKAADYFGRITTTYLITEGTFAVKY